MQPLAIEKAETRVEVTYRPPTNASQPSVPILLPVGLMLKVLDWGRDWNNAEALADAAQDYLLKNWTERRADAACAGRGTEAGRLPRTEQIRLESGAGLSRRRRRWRRAAGGQADESGECRQCWIRWRMPSIAAGNWAEAVKAWEDMLVG